MIEIYYIHHEFVHDIYDINMNFFFSTSTTEMVILRHKALCSILNTHLQNVWAGHSNQIWVFALTVIK